VEHWERLLPRRYSEKIGAQAFRQSSGRENFITKELDRTPGELGYRHGAMQMQNHGGDVFGLVSGRPSRLQVDARISRTTDLYVAAAT